jgi:hypothetical protein
LGDNSVYDVLLLAGLEEACTTFLIEAGEYLLEFVDRIVLDSMSYRLSVSVVCHPLGSPEA